MTPRKVMCKLLLLITRILIIHYYISPLYPDNCDRVLYFPFPCDAIRMNVSLLFEISIFT